MVRIMIVDDHTLMRRVVREVLEKESDFEVVAEARNGLEAEEQAARVKPEVILMDLDMPDCDGFEGTERVLASSPQSHVVIFTASHHERHLFQALQRGAMGYLTKDIEPDALVHAIRCAARNELCLPGSFATQVVAHLRTMGKEHELRMWDELLEPDEQDEEEYKARPHTKAVAYRVPRRPSLRRTQTPTKAMSPTVLEQAPTTRPLTEREQEILDLMRKGQKNREIAGELSIAESTVHKHVQNIFEKLHARNRTEAIYLTSAGK